MFGFLTKKNEKAEAKKARARFAITGMHCTSCSMNIDGELEELTGVESSSTSYATATTVVVYDAARVSVARMKKAIEDLGYQVQETV